MAITTYAELKTAMANWSHRSDLTSYLDDFIQQTEAFFKYPPLRPDKPGIPGIRANITKATGTLSAITLARPSDFFEAFRFELTADNGGLLEYIGSEQMSLATRSGTGKPYYWTVNDVIELDITPDSTYPYELSYYPDYAGLDGSTADNWVLLNYPNVYLSGCMYHLNTFIMDTAGADRWMMQYKSGVHALNTAYQRSRRSQGPAAAKVA